MRNLLWGFAVVITASIVILGCQKELSSTADKNPVFDKNAAKEWWYGTFRKSPDYTFRNWASVFAASPGSSTKKYPDWKRAISYKKFDFEIVELPLFYVTNNILLPGMQNLKNTKEGERIARSSTHKLLLIKKVNGTILVRTVTIVPSAEYARKNNYDISHIQSYNLPSDFEGYLMIAGWDESEKNTVKIEKGKTVRKIKLITEEELAKYTTKVNKNGTLICPYPVYVPHMQFTCVIVPTGDAVADQERCQENGEWGDSGGSYEIPDCYDEEDPNDPMNECITLGGNLENCYCSLFVLNCEEYEGGGETSPPLITNNVDNPCIHASIENAINMDCKDKISTFINNVFANSQVNHLRFEDAILTGTHSGDDAYTVTGPIMSGTETMTTITLNNSQLSSSTREYIAATILHEAIHAWIDYQYTNPVTAGQQHSLMASTSRFNMMRDALLDMFPSMSPQDASDLTWGGLYNTPLFQNLPALEKDRIIQKNLDYKNHTASTGTPC